MLSLGTSYSKYFNIKYNLVGRLFQERFRAKIVETDEYLLHLSRYIHLNPVSDELERLDFLASTPGVEARVEATGVEVRKLLIDYPWSSFGEYNSDAKGVCNKKRLLDYFSGSRKNISYATFVFNGIQRADRIILENLL